MEAPKALKELRGFIGMVNYYHDMWPHRAHILTPLTSQTGAPPKRANTTKIYLNGRNANCIQSDESAYGPGCPLSLSKS